MTSKKGSSAKKGRHVATREEADAIVRASARRLPKRAWRRKMPIAKPGIARARDLRAREPYPPTREAQSIGEALSRIPAMIEIVKGHLKEAREQISLIGNGEVTTIEEANDLINSNACATIDALQELTSAVEHIIFVRSHD